MTDTRAARHELGWLVDDETVEAVHLPEMFELRRQWPRSSEQATTSREQLISDMLDSGITAALTAIGVVSTPTSEMRWRGRAVEIPAVVDPDERWISIARAGDAEVEALRAACAAMAVVCCGMVKRITAADEEFDERDHQDVLLTEALGGDAAKLYAGTFAPPPIDDEDAEDWWVTLGWNSFADWAAGEQEMREMEDEVDE